MDDVLVGKLSQRTNKFALVSKGLNGRSSVDLLNWGFTFYFISFNFIFFLVQQFEIS